MKLIVHTDGGARGNPGPAAIGVVIENETSDKRQGTGSTKEIAAFGKRIGETTNNVAEYTAVIEALLWLKNNPTRLQTPERSDGGQVTEYSNKQIIEFYLDSTLVVNQLNGLFKVKDAHLRELLSTIRILEQEVGAAVHYAHVPREQNVRADILVNKALDTPHVV
jgi:ribonuclease HI